MSTKKPPADTSYWADEKVPDLSTLLGEYGIDAEEFAQWLAPLLGNYRGYTQVREALDPPASVAAKSLADLINALQATSTELRPNRRPGTVDAHLYTAAHKSQIDLHALIARMRADARALSALAMQAQAALQAQPSKAGRRPVPARDALLASVVRRLREGKCTAELARHLAEQILRKSGVPLPSGERAIRRAETGGQKLR